MGLRSHAPLHLMIAGKRAIPKKLVPVIIESLKLSPQAGLYFETMVELDRARKPEQKEFYLRRLKQLGPRDPLKMHEVEQFTVIKEPLHVVLLEMTDLKDFKEDSKWIQSRLGLEATEKQIQEAISRLLGLGLLHRDSSKKLKKSNQHVTTRPDVADLGVQEYHRRVLQMAAELLAQQPVGEREYNGYALNIKRSSLPLAKKLIREFIKKFIEQIEANASDSEETYQFNIQLFALTQKRRGK